MTDRRMGGKEEEMKEGKNDRLHAKKEECMKKQRRTKGRKERKTKGLYLHLRGDGGNVLERQAV